MVEEKKKLTFSDGFWFGLGFFTAGIVFYIIAVIVTLLLFGTMIGSVASHW